MFNLLKAFCVGLLKDEQRSLSTCNPLCPSFPPPNVSSHPIVFTQPLYSCYVKSQIHFDTSVFQHESLNHDLAISIYKHCIYICDWRQEDHNHVLP